MCNRFMIFCSAARDRSLWRAASETLPPTPLLSLDEPTSALDFSNQIKIMNILRKLADQGAAIVACMHDPNHVLWFCDSVVVLDKQRLIAQGPLPRSCATPCWTFNGTPPGWRSRATLGA